MNERRQTNEWAKLKTKANEPNKKKILKNAYVETKQSRNNISKQNVSINIYKAISANKG